MPEISRGFTFEHSCVIEFTKPRCLSWLCENCFYIKRFCCCCSLKFGAFILYIGSFIYLPYYRICSCKQDFFLSKIKLASDFNDLKAIYDQAIAFNPFDDINKYILGLYKPIKNIVMQNLMCFILFPYVLLSFFSLLFLLMACSPCCRCLSTVLLLCIFLSQALNTFIIGTIIDGVAFRECECFENWPWTLHSLIFYPIWFYFYIVIRSFKRLRKEKAKAKKLQQF
nr:uncharacterized protein LOC116769177 isoform X2 [Danaus plexippus plexippus]